MIDDLFPNRGGYQQGQWPGGEQGCGCLVILAVVVLVVIFVLNG